MLEGMYTAAAGLAAQQQRLDALSNDVANVSTVGYQRMRVAFRDLVYTASGPGGQPGVMEGSGAAVSTIGRGGTGASLENTGNSLDVAIQGDGYLQVTQPDGTTALTRAGSLSIDSQRRLLANGLPLQPPVQVPNGVDETKLAIAPDGAVTSADGQAVGTIRLFSVRSPDRLQAIGGNLLLPTQASGAATPAGAATTLQQGVLETSDVDMADVMSDMVMTQRNYSMASQAIKTQDQMAEIANGVKR